jgi:hypothetical protein
MDLRLVFRVVRRFKLLVLAGALLGAALAVLSVANVSFAGGKPELTYRKSEEWASYARLLLTTPSLRAGSSLVDPASPNAAAAIEAQATIQAQLPSLATLYSSFVTGDDVTRILLEGGPINGILAANALQAPNGGGVLPIIQITAMSDTPLHSQQLGDRAATSLATYIDRTQKASQPERRVQLRVLNRAGQTELVGPRSKMLPMVVFLVVLFGAVGLALMLENTRPRPVEAAEPADEPEAEPAPAATHDLELRRAL